jgi:hypothetical protein
VSSQAFFYQLGVFRGIAFWARDQDFPRKMVECSMWEV